MALEAAKRGIARNVVAISPIGLWPKHEPRHVQYVFGALRFLATWFPSVLRGMVLCPMLRQVALAVPISTGARHMPVDDAIEAVMIWQNRWSLRRHSRALNAFFGAGHRSAGNGSIRRSRLDPP